MLLPGNTRFFAISKASTASGKLRYDRYRAFDAAVEAIYRGGKALDVTDTALVQVGDNVAISGAVGVMDAASSMLGPKSSRPDMTVVLESERSS
ncbi:hypothetical protein [Burkholderia sp. PAMC 28687]|uniref:hypothetical protein n=1 Tax=Burkholderia sp. PAMC 28687 TaxID=1795874 RepID=UPI0009ECABEC|nr:hypothetical protein [Burkholderia sp. PAMC 28687]